LYGLSGIRVLLCRFLAAGIAELDVTGATVPFDTATSSAAAWKKKQNI